MSSADTATPKSPAAEPPRTPAASPAGLNVRMPGPGRSAVVLEDLDIAAVDAAQAAAIRELCYVHQFVSVPGQQHADDAAFVAFARALGTPVPYFQEHYHHPEHPEIFVSNNVPWNGGKVGVAGTGRMWHADYSFFERPLAITMVRPMVLPSVRRETLYVDLRQAWAELPDDLRSVFAEARCFHDASDYYKVQPWDVDRAIVELVEEFHRVAPGAWHPAVVTHPFTGERNLFVSRGFTRKIEGRSDEESRELLGALFDFCERDEFRHCIPWREGEILLWDNRSLIHHASKIPPGEPSRSFRIGIYDELPFCAG